MSNEIFTRISATLIRFSIGFILESTKIEDNDVFELYRTCGGAELVLALPLLAQKGANFSAKGTEGVGLLFIDHRIDLYEVRIFFHYQIRILEGYLRILKSLYCFCQ